MEIKEITFDEFRRFGTNVFARHGVKVVKIRGKHGKYVNIYYHDRKDDLYTRDGDILIDKLGKRFRECRLCGSLECVRFIVPFDGSIQAGSYCLRCRKKHSIMDVKDAKRYNKIL